MPLKHRTACKHVVWFWLLLWGTCGVLAAPVSISFLQDDGLLRDTVARLEAKGCGKESLAKFQRAVRQYNAGGLNLDLNKFPKEPDGIYVFSSAEAALSALPHELCDTVHAYEINCFDTVILLTDGLLDSRLDVDDICATLCVPKTGTNNFFQFVAAVTPAEGFSALYPSWYIDVTKPWFTERQRSRRVGLSAALFSSNFLPTSTTEQSLGSNVLRVLTALWKRQQVTFPASVEVVLCHDIRFPALQFVTPHVGLLWAGKGGFTYLEKAGACGPFVRLDVAERKDLIAWLAPNLKSGMDFTHRFVTFNNTQIERVPARSPPTRGTR